MTARLYQPYVGTCRVCRKEHWAASKAAFEERVIQCQTEHVGFLQNREYLQKHNLPPAQTNPDAETVVKPIQVAS